MNKEIWERDAFAGTYACKLCGGEKKHNFFKSPLRDDGFYHRIPGFDYVHGHYQTHWVAKELIHEVAKDKGDGNPDGQERMDIR